MASKRPMKKLIGFREKMGLKIVVEFASRLLKEWKRMSLTMVNERLKEWQEAKCCSRSVSHILYYHDATCAQESSIFLVTVSALIVTVASEANESARPAGTERLILTECSGRWMQARGKAQIGLISNSMKLYPHHPDGRRPH